MTAIQIAKPRRRPVADRDVGGAAQGPTRTQYALAALLLASLTICLTCALALTLTVLHLLIVFGCALSACSKLVLALIGKEPPRIDPIRRDRLPRYTILAPCYREGPVIAQLVAALSALDYPRDRLQAILILEADDLETLGALAWLNLPPFIEILVCPPDGPRTKPNALNVALPLVRGEFTVVYDAEDVPAPDQLQEAAARFQADSAIACLQAPLRIANDRAGFLTRQFALEYAGQFEAVLPGLSRLATPFPLGGTSNHLRTSVLLEIGGWDAFNVTEDADLGFRLGGRQRVAMMTAPTRENAPESFDDWLPQRTRWVKGYMQTWGVHMRRPLAGGWKRLLALQATLGMAILGAALHAPLILLLLSTLLTDALDGYAAPSVVMDVSVLIGGWSAAALANAVGARKAGLRMRFTDALACLAYWPLQSLAFVFAVHQLVRTPYHWDKTPHVPMDGSVTADSAAPLDADAPWSVSPAA